MDAAISLGTELWKVWAFICLEHRDEARESREEAGGPPAMNSELQASMVAICAAAFAVDGLAADVRELGFQPKGLPDEPPRAVVVAETLRANFELGGKTNSWPKELKRLFQLRSTDPGGGLAHPKTTFADPVPLPKVPPAPARMTYTVETAEWAASLMSEIAAGCTAEHLRRGAPDELRDRATGYKSYAEEFARRS